MERLLLTLIVLVIIGSAAALTELPGLEAQSYAVVGAVQSQEWVRTTHGWEQATWKEETVVIPAVPPSPATQLDPRVVGTLQLLLSVVALLVWTKRTERTPPAGNS